VEFWLGVSDGRTFRELMVRHVDPFHVADDRRWVPVTVDLSDYSGLDLSLVFNTRASPRNAGNDQRNDKAVWGEPAIVALR
jgi:hypothetical protein